MKANVRSSLNIANQKFDQYVNITHKSNTNSVKGQAMYRSDCVDIQTDHACRKDTIREALPEGELGLLCICGV